jgi:CRISPR system Cascade subunit CasA
MNLINDPWIPIVRRDGKTERIAPWQITESENPIIALDAPRPDFNGALLQFLIGLLQTTATPENHEKWLDWLEQPPTPETLKQCFAKYAQAFEILSNKGSFMQDFDDLDSDENSIAELLIESPGGNTVKENKDHFIKRGQIDTLCTACAATALFTLQTNAPTAPLCEMEAR